MLYISTRQSDPSDTKTFREVFLCGLAEDGGLFVPQSIPAIDLCNLRDLKFEEIAYIIFREYISCNEIPDNDLRDLLNSSFRTFRSKNGEVTPLVKLDNGLYILELFHGPSFSFKDIALQVVGALFSYFTSNTHRTIVTATSGDTGSAAIHSVKGKRGLSCFVLFPKDNISAVQQAQMATESVTNANIHTIAVEGTFDDCQDAVKALFMDAEFKGQVGLSAVNSINWARVLTQMTYYFYAFSRLRGYQNVQFSVPTGNFGDILAGYYALRMGLPIGKLIIATNRNDILTRFMRTGVYRRTVLIGTLAPAMDITISSNFERLLWHVLERELGGVAASEQIISWMCELRRVGAFSVPSEMLGRIQEIFTSQSIDDECILQTIRDINDSYDYLIDPHTATGVCAAVRNAGDGITVCLATAHPGKFPETIGKALDITDKKIDFVPKPLRELLDKPQMIHFMKVYNLVHQLKKFILDREVEL